MKNAVKIKGCFRQTILKKRLMHGALSMGIALKIALKKVQAEKLRPLNLYYDFKKSVNQIPFHDGIKNLVA